MDSDKLGDLIEEVQKDIGAREQAQASLRAEIQHLNQRLVAISDELNNLHWTFKYLHRKRLGQAPVGASNLISELEGGAVAFSGQTPDQPDWQPLIDQADPDTVTHGDVAFDILNSEPRPMKVAEIVQEMRTRNHRLPEETSVAFNTVYTSMKRRPHDFMRVGNGFWCLRRSDKSGYRDVIDAWLSDRIRKNKEAHRLVTRPRPVNDQVDSPSSVSKHTDGLHSE